MLRESAVTVRHVRCVCSPRGASPAPPSLSARRHRDTHKIQFEKDEKKLKIGHNSNLKPHTEPIHMHTGLVSKPLKHTHTHKRRLLKGQSEGPPSQSCVHCAVIMRSGAGRKRLGLFLLRGRYPRNLCLAEGLAYKITSTSNM